MVNIFYYYKWNIYKSMKKQSYTIKFTLTIVKSHITNAKRSYLQTFFITETDNLKGIN